VLGACDCDASRPRPAYWILISLLIAATFIDIGHFIIPDEITLGGTVAGFLCCLALPGLMGTSSILVSGGLSLAGAALGAGLLWLVVEGGQLAFGKKTPLREGRGILLGPGWRPCRPPHRRRNQPLGGHFQPRKRPACSQSRRPGRVRRARACSRAAPIPLRPRGGGRRELELEQARPDFRRACIGRPSRARRWDTATSNS